MGVHKKFNEGLYKEHDHPACQAALKFLCGNQGLFAIRNDDKYGPDIVVYGGFKPSYYVECEIKNGWKAGQDRFPFKDINIPERKRKFLTAGLPIEFWILRADLKFAAIIADTSVLDMRLVEVPNKYVASGEKFFKIPINECNIVEL